MELLRGARNRQEFNSIRAFLSDSNFMTIPLAENISSRASIYVEEHCLKVDVGVADALIAATAVEYSLVLCTGNGKHYKLFGELMLKSFRP